MSQDRRTWRENGWLKATRDGEGRCDTVGARSVWARVGGCLEQEFRDLDWKDWIRDSTRMAPAFGRGRRIYPVRCARKAATMPISIFEYRAAQGLALQSMMCEILTARRLEDS